MSGGDHQFLAASAAATWGPCPGSAAMRAMHPEPETEDTRAGDACHWYADQRLNGRMVLDQAAPNGVVLSDEVKEAALVYVQDVRDYLAAVIGAGMALAAHGSESRGEAVRIHPEHCGGTTDYFAWVPPTGRTRGLLVVWDLKYGHKEVEPHENLQLTVYAEMLLERFAVDGHAEQSVDVEFRVAQPRCYTARGAVRAWRTPAVGLRPLVNMLAASAAEAVRSGAPTRSGPHCYHCSAAHACSAARQAAYAFAEFSGRAVPELLPPEALSFELHVLQRARQAVDLRLAAVEEAAAAALREGRRVPGYAMMPTVPRAAWTVPVEQVRALGENLGYRLTREVPVTPVQARDMGVDEFTLAAFAARPPGGLKLGRQDAAEVRRVLSGAGAPSIPDKATTKE